MDRKSILLRLSNKTMLMLPWLIFSISLLFMVKPGRALVRVLENQRLRAISSSTSTNYGNPKVIAKSDHFQILSYDNYIDKSTIGSFLKKAESQRPKVLAFLPFSVKDKITTIVFLPDCNISTSGSNSWITINSCNDPYISHFAVTVFHEWTHMLMISQTPEGLSNLFGEGMAVMVGERFGWGLLDDPLSDGLYPYLRIGKVISISELWKTSWSADPYQPELTSKRYSESGSFARYLIQHYGIKKYLESFRRNGDFEIIYDQPITELENSWLTTLRRGNLVQAIFLALGGLAVMGVDPLLDKRMAMASCCFRSVYRLYRVGDVCKLQFHLDSKLPFHD